MNCTKTRKYFFSVFLLLLFSKSLVYAQTQDLLHQEITIAFEDLSLKESLAKLEKTAGISTAYNEREIKDSKVTVTFEKELLSEVLDALLANENLSYKVIGNTVTIFRKEKKKEKQKEIKAPEKSSLKSLHLVAT